MKYRNAFIWILMYILITAFTLIINTGGSFSKIIPGNYNGMNLTFIFTFCIIFSIFFGIIFSFLLAPLYLFVHRYFIGQNVKYGIQEIPRQEKFKKIFRGVFPGLMAINIAIILTPVLMDGIITETALNNLNLGQHFFYTFLSLLPYTLGPTLGLFSAAWFLNDAGVGYSNKEKAIKKEDFVEIRSIGGWFLYSLKGYAGITVIFSYITILNSYILLISAKDLWYVLILTFSLPLLLAIAIMPTLIILDLMKEKRRKYVLAIARKMGITEPLEI